MSAPFAAVASEVDVKDLTRSDWIRVWWGTWWRGFVVTACALAVTVVLGFVTGAAFGVLITLAHAEVKAFLIPLRLVGGVLGFGVGVASFPFWLRWVLRSNYGRLRFALVSTSPNVPDTMTELTPPTVAPEFGP